MSKPDDALSGIWWAPPDPPTPAELAAQEAFLAAMRVAYGGASPEEQAAALAAHVIAEAKKGPTG